MSRARGAAGLAVAGVLALALTCSGAAGAAARHDRKKNHGLSLRSRVLSRSDLPGGWSYTPHGSDAPAANSREWRCLAPVARLPSGAHADASFADGGLGLHEVVLVGKAGLRAYSRLAASLANCKPQPITTAGETGMISVRAMPFPKITQRSWAYRVTLTVGPVQARSDLIGFRTDRAAAIVTMDGLGVPRAARVEAFVAEAVKKVEGKHPAPVPAT